MKKRPKRITYQRRKPHNDVSELQIRLIRQLVCEGVSKAAIAQALGLSRMHVYRLAEKYCE